MKQLTYAEELAQLADELQADDRSLTRAEALKQAREQMQALYVTALEWTRVADAQRSTLVKSA